ncbi:hypothetical protein FEM03_11475 [Phragmitibacter flavus]|uniref:Uncharacterized protein n=1 Tax=Phragmitibacter flavus TaxID=2576071 RepID=A0A5R8KFH3_9BACT|nr:hypothetical protein [Phragmitibacter flavus]TLD70349.1 hypothetical protein FEM03_11475 [Phragmitibacter flavus]
MKLCGRSNLDWIERWVWHVSWHLRGESYNVVDGCGQHLGAKAEVQSLGKIVGLSTEAVAEDGPTTVADMVRGLANGNAKPGRSKKGEESLI